MEYVSGLSTRVSSAHAPNDNVVQLTVDHHSLLSHGLQREHSIDRAPVEFDRRSDTVAATSQGDDSLVGKLDVMLTGIVGGLRKS